MDKLVTLQFQKAGMLTTIQDIGRRGYQAFGVPIGGAMDQSAARIANELVGNSPNHPVLEITLLGPTIHFNQSAQIAITGANLSPTLNKQPVPLYETNTLKANDVLSFGRILSGCRAYLAIGGIWDMPQWLSSSSAVHPNKEVLPTSIIQKESTIKIQPKPFVNHKVYPIADRPTIPHSSSIPVMPGPEFDQFTNYQIAQFFSQTFTIANNSNRMGYRLEGKPLSIEGNRAMISSGIVPGTVQINNAGLPIVLMRDAQTTGGYPRIVNVLEEGIDQLAQKKPSEQIRFTIQPR